jgi:putative hydrolase of the HAD superfamily
MNQLVVCFDLDDTLYKEIDFLKSGYRKVADMVEKRYGYDSHDVYERLLSWYNQEGNPFESLNETYGIDNPIGDYLNIYRFHHPSITLPSDVAKTLTELKEKDVLMGIISDGREETQKNKIEALGLTEWICPDLVFINEDKKYFKPSHWSYDRTMLKCFEKNVDPDAKFYYVGDNTEKDFMAPNQLGWDTICLLDDGRNIHKQNFEIENIKLPKKTIASISELVNILG